MKYKSDENLNAAYLLINNNMYAASIHCSYYSCFQLSKHILKNQYGIDYVVQESESAGRDSHCYVFNETANKIEAVSHLYFIDFKRLFSQLKKLRKKADYSVEFISEKEAKKAYKSANNIMTILNKK